MIRKFKTIGNNEKCIAAWNEVANAKGKSAVIVSGGMDSSILGRLVEYHSDEEVLILSADYGQKQKVELFAAKKNFPQQIVMQMPALRDASIGYSANVDENIDVPPVEEVLGLPTPPTQVPNRNMILLSTAGGFCEANGILNLYIGIQLRDQYGYFDATAEFVEAMNQVFALNRACPTKVRAPFGYISKYEELLILDEICKSTDEWDAILKSTLTCYDPQVDSKNRVVPCGRCASCHERATAFKKIGRDDPSIPKD